MRTSEKKKKIYTRVFKLKLKTQTAMIYTINFELKHIQKHKTLHIHF